MQKLLRIHDVSMILRVAVRTLRLWRMQGTGPRAGLYGKHLRYRPSEVERYQLEREREPVGRAR